MPERAGVTLGPMVRGAEIGGVGTVLNSNYFAEELGLVV